MTVATRPLHKAGIQSSVLQKLQRLGIDTLLDLLHYYPRDHIVYRCVRISQARMGDTVTIIGRIKSHKIFTARNGRLTVQTWTIVNKSATVSITCTHFYNPDRYQSYQWRSQQCDFYRTGRIVMLSGKIKQDSYTGGKAIDAAEVKMIDLAGIASTPKDNSIQSIYSLTKGVTGAMIQECLQLALRNTNIIDPLPAKLRAKYNLVELSEAITHIHFPPSRTALRKARRRLVFDEFFYLQLNLLQRRQASRQIQRDVLLVQDTLLRQFYDILPFQLTSAQQRVVNEILEDLDKPTPMNRLVQGDVGSGKTIVAVATILAVVQSGYQAALMAPTEVLAEQHYHKITHWFQCLKLPVALLTGSTPTANRQRIHQRLQCGAEPGTGARGVHHHQRNCRAQS